MPNIPYDAMSEKASLSPKGMLGMGGVGGGINVSAKASELQIIQNRLSQLDQRMMENLDRMVEQLAYVFGQGVRGEVYAPENDKMPVVENDCRIHDIHEVISRIDRNMDCLARAIGITTRL